MMMTEATARFHVFEAALQSDMKRLVLVSAAKSCELDPLPKSPMKSHIECLSPVLAPIIHTPLSSYEFPRSMKHAIILNCYPNTIEATF